jgi:putative oxidoreductase
VRAVNGTGWTRDAAEVAARLALGGSMLYHGLAKLRGEGPARTEQFLSGIGLRNARFWARATGVAETFAGAAAVLGLATRPAALAVITTQAVAIQKVHRPKGFDVAQGGMEYNLALVAIAVGLLLSGPGRLSAHHAARRAAVGSGWRGLGRRVRAPRLVQALEALA